MAVGVKKSRRSARKDMKSQHARRKAGLVAKAGKRRPPSIKSRRDKDGKRHWEAT